MKPVELEFLMKDGVTPGVEKAGRAVREFTDSSKEAMAELKASIQEQKKVISDLEAETVRLEKAWHNAAPGDAWFAAKNKLEATQQQLDEEKRTLEELTARYNELKSASTESQGKASEAAANLQNITNATGNELKLMLQGQKKAISELEAEATKLGQALLRATPGDEATAAEAQFSSTVQRLEEEKKVLEELTARYNELGTSAETNNSKAESSARKHDSVLIKLLGGQKNYNEIMSKMPPSLQAAATGINGMTGAARAFIATPLGAILAAIVLALQAVSTWFTSSAEGEMEFARMSGYLGGILDQLKEVVMAVGKALSKAFTDPKQAINDLWEYIKSQFINRLQGTAGIVTNFGKGIWHALTGNFDAAKTDFSQMGNDILRATTGVDNLAGKTKDWLHNTHELAKANSEIAVQEKQLHRDRRQWSVEEQKMDNEISELRLKAQRGDAEANKKAQELIKEKYNRNIEYQQRELDLIRQKNSLTTNSDADYDKEAEAQRKLLALEKERNTELSFFNRKDFSLGNKAATLAERQLTAETKLHQELLELQRRNDAEEIAIMDEGTAKKLRQIDNDYTKRKNEIAKLEASWRKDNKTAGYGESLTTEQQAALEEAGRLNEQLRSKAVGEVYDAEWASMRENVERYGDYQAQKLAIAEDYAEKIRKAQNEGERRSLGRERDTKLAQVTTAEMKANIEWGVVFGEFGGMFREVIEPELAEVREYVQTDEFKGADHDSQQALLDALRQMENAAGETTAASFGQLGREIDAYRASTDGLRAAQEQYKEDFGTLISAQQDYKAAVQSGNPVLIRAAELTLNAAQAQVDASAEDVAARKEAADEAKRTVTQTATTLKEGMDGVLGGLQKMASGSASGVLTGFTELGKGAAKLNGNIGKSFGEFAKKLENAPVVGWIAALLDVFKEGLSDFMVSLIDAVTGAAANILSDVLSGDFAVNTAKSLVGGVGKVLDTVTFGLFQAHGNEAEVEASLNRLTEANGRLEASMDSLRETISAGRGMTSVEAYREARQNQERINANYMDMIRAQAEYHSSKHSWNATRRGFTADEIRQISEVIGHAFSGDFFSLSPEDMKAFRDQLPNLWRDFFYSGDSDNYADRVLEKVNDYIAQAGKLGELRTQLTEAMTGVTFDGMYSNFLSKLSDMEYAAGDAAEDISEMFYKAMVSNKIGELYFDDLQAWYDNWGAAMEKGLGPEDIERLQKEYQAIVEGAIKTRDELAAMTGYNPDKGDGGSGQSGRGGSYSAMSQDQGTKLEGLFVSVQGHVISIAGWVEDVAARMSAAEGYLRDIAANTKNSDEKLGKILELVEKMERDGINWN